MSIQQAIEAKLATRFPDDYYEVANESGNHSRGTETHFKVSVASDAFNQLRAVARHRVLHELLADELAGPVHALALHLFTREEWLARHGEVPPSPACAHGKAGSLNE